MMAIHVHLIDRDGGKAATFHGVEKAVSSVGVVKYMETYYSYHHFETDGHNFHLFYAETYVMEVKL